MLHVESSLLALGLFTLVFCSGCALGPESSSDEQFVESTAQMEQGVNENVEATSFDALKTFLESAQQEDSVSGLLISKSELQKAIKVAKSDSDSPGVVDLSEASVIELAWSFRAASGYYATDAARTLFGKLVQSGVLSDPSRSATIAVAKQESATSSIVNVFDQAFEETSPAGFSVAKSEVVAAVHSALNDASSPGKIDEMEAAMLAVGWLTTASGYYATTAARTYYSSLVGKFNLPKNDKTERVVWAAEFLGIFE